MAVHLLGLLVACGLLISCQATLYNPCDPLVSTARGDAFVIGLAFMPGSNATALNNVQRATELGLCAPELQNALVANFSAKIAVFNTKVDRLQVLRMPFTDIIFSIGSVTVPPTMTVVAFRANISSEPVYIFSADEAYTKGVGFVVSLALLARFERGILTYLQWYDQTCNECGGRNRPGSLCVESATANAYACATPLANCTCVGSSNPNCSFADSTFDACSPAINMAWSGTDSNDYAFRTGTQVTRLTAFSITGLFSIALDKYRQIKDIVQTNIKSQWSGIQSDINAQQTEFGNPVVG